VKHDEWCLTDDREDDLSNCICDKLGGKEDTVTIDILERIARTCEPDPYGYVLLSDVRAAVKGEQR
jgi:hypothetical protein